MSSQFVASAGPGTAAAARTLEGSAPLVQKSRFRSHRRGKRRTPHRVPCRLRVFDGTTGQVLALCGQTVNISADGLAVQVSESVAVGTWLEALVPQLDGSVMTISGSVAHCRRVLSGTFEVGINRAVAD